MLKVIIVAGVFSFTLFQTPGKATGETVTLGKVCDGKIAIAPSSLSLTEDGDAQCVTVKEKAANVFQREKRAILDRLNRKSIELGARSEGALKELGYIDDAIVKALVENYSLIENSHAINKDFIFNIIDPKEISFMFKLSRAAYYKTDFSKNVNNTSTAYQQKMNTLKAESDNLESTLKRINKFKKTIKDALENTVVRFKGTQAEARSKSAQEKAGFSKMEGGQGNAFAFKNKTGEGTDLAHAQTSNLSAEEESKGKGKTESSEIRTEGENVKIVSLASEAVRSIREQYKAVFSEMIPGDATLADIEKKITTLEVNTKNDLLEKKRVLSRFGDPRVEAYWAKLERTFDLKADHLEPIDILYRNFDYYKMPVVLHGFIKSKDQPLSIIDKKKELSGVVMYKKHDKNSNVDELIIAFSGSKSSEDWKHNFDIFRQSGEASTQLGAGLKVHKGIFQSLAASLEDSGTNINFWVQQYLKGLDPQKPKPTLKFTITGHSLGGGLALLMGTWIHQNIKSYLANRVNVEIVVYTFGAPPIFRGESVEDVENMLGKENVIRVWNIGDPVANISILRKEFKDQDPSLLMLLSGYRHVGISVPLFDNKNLTSFFDKLSPWNNHLGDKYYNLIETNNVNLVNNKINLMEKKLKSNQFFSNQIYQGLLDGMIKFIRNPSDRPVETFLLKQIPFKQFQTDILEEENKNEVIALHMKNYEEIKKQREQKGISASPELKRSTRKDEEIQYNHNLMSMTVPMKVNRSTSCDFGALKKKFISKLKKDQQGALGKDEQSELSCVCCLAKNFILTNQTLIEKTKKLLKGKKISTVSETISYCDKYCTPLKNNGILKTGVGDVDSVRKLLQEATGNDISEAFGAIELKPVK
jgi:hypothetical protein